jgi:hypothetical protein
LSEAGPSPVPAYPLAYPLSWTPAFNWSDSPLLLDLHQYGGFNDNIFNSPPGYTRVTSEPENPSGL